VVKLGSKTPKKIVEKSINFKILALIAAAAVGYQVLLYYDFQDILNITDSLYLLTIAVVAIMMIGLIVSKNIVGLKFLEKHIFFFGYTFRWH